MFEIPVAVEENYVNIIRPTIFESLKKVIKFYGLESVATIFYNGESEVAKLVGSNFDDKLKTDLYTAGLNNNKLFVVPEITTTDFNNGYQNSRRGESEMAIFRDNDLGLNIYPSNNGNKVSVNVVGYFTSRRAAETFVSRINRLQAAQGAYITFDSNIHIPINESILDLLESVHQILVRNDPSTEPSALDWIEKRFVFPTGIISNLAGNHQRLVVKQKYKDMAIQFEDAIIQKARKASVYGAYEVTMSYSFYFQIVEHFNVHYPLNVYQEEIPEKFIPRPNEAHRAIERVMVNPAYAMIRDFVVHDKAQVPEYLILPQHDSWRAPLVWWCQPVMQARLALEDLEEQVLVDNIFDIPGMTWNPEVKDYILRNRHNAFRHHETYFPIFIYSNDIQVRHDRLTLDQHGKVTMRGKPNLKNTYRIVMSFDQAIRDYSPNMWNATRRDPATETLLESLFPWIDWDKISKPYANHEDELKIAIEKGIGYRLDNIDRYQMDFGLLMLNESTRK